MPRPREFDETEALAAALELFWEKGYEATSLQDLTDRMGIRRGSLYHAFGDKHALFARALAIYQADLLHWYRQWLERPGTVREALQGLFSEVVDRASTEERPRSRGCLCVNTAIELAPHDPAVARLIERHDRSAEDLFRRALERGRSAGEFSARLDPASTAQFLLNALAGLAVARKTDAEADRLRDIVRLTLSVLDQPGPSLDSF